MTPLMPMLSILVLMYVSITVALAASVAVVAMAGTIAASGVLDRVSLQAFLTRRPMSLVRQVFLQLGAFVGVPCGLWAFALADRLYALHLAQSEMLLLGGLSGLIAGLSIAALAGRLWQAIFPRLRKSPHAPLM